MASTEERLNEIEQRLHNLTHWVVYWDGDIINRKNSQKGLYKYCNLGFAKRTDIKYLPTEYESAHEASEAALELNNKNDVSDEKKETSPTERRENDQRGETGSQTNDS